jgi:hypothetical protein
MFDGNPSWNKPFSEEILRWNIVEGFVKYIYKNNNIELNLCMAPDLGCEGWLTNLLLKYGNILGIEPKPVLDYAKKIPLIWNLFVAQQKT